MAGLREPCVSSTRSRVVISRSCWSSNTPYGHLSRSGTFGFVETSSSLLPLHRPHPPFRLARAWFPAALMDPQLTTSAYPIDTTSARGGPSFRYNAGANTFSAPATAVVLKPMSSSSIAVLSSGGEAAAATERLASHATAAVVAAPSKAMRMGIVGPGVGRAVGKGLAAAALATVSGGGGGHLCVASS